MSKTPNYDAKVKAILDATKPGERVCALTGQKWNMTEEELRWCRFFSVPPSRIHPLVRLKMLFANNSGLSLWWNKHAETGKPLLSYVHPDSPIKVLPDKEWWEKMSNGEPGRALHLDTPFFPQMLELRNATPVRALSDPGDSVNTIGMAAHKCVDGYMNLGVLGAERSDYIYGCTLVFDSVDVTSSFGGITECSSINRCRTCFNCHAALESYDCRDSWGLFDCRNCEFCFGATNKRHQKYLWFNEQLTKEEWERRRASVDLSSWKIHEEYKKKIFELVGQAVWPERFNIAETESTGEYLEKVTRVHACHNLQNSTDCLGLWLGTSMENCAYVTGSGMCSSVWYSSGCVSCENIKYALGLTACQGMEYSMGCNDCENCFGCVGLVRKKFHILNKPYKEEAYWKTLDDLKCAMLERGEYGEKLSMEFHGISPQFSAGAIFCDYTPEEIRLWGGTLFDPKRGTMYLPEGSQHKTPIVPADLPDKTSETPDTITVTPIQDPDLGRPYTVTARELAFYRRHHLPVPRHHFFNRLRSLIRLSNSPLTQETECSSCHKHITHNPNLTFSKKTILCHDCYLQYLEKNG